MYHVYKIINKTNQKIYIGITSREIEDRWQEHLSRARCGQRNSRLYDAISKYGKDNFYHEHLASTPHDTIVRKMEEWFIEYYDTYKNGYNCNLGGCGFLEFPEHIKKKISDAQIGKIISLESRRKMSKAKQGDKSCAKHFGKYIRKGKNNPLSKSFLIQFPDGHQEVIKGLRAFCRKQNINQSRMSSTGKSKGFILLKRFRDYPEREYTQAGGSACLPYR